LGDGKFQYKAFPETKIALEQIALSYRLAMITNTQGQRSSGGHRISLFPALEKLFEVVIVAGEHGMPPKPDPMPFLTCLERLGIDPANAIYIGDDWRIDVCGAQAAGIQPVWLKHHSISRNWPVIETTIPIITSLEQVLDLEIIKFQSHR
jgi:putative hydrolase of the HAD superfamily